MSRLDIPVPEEGFGLRAGDRLVYCIDPGNDYKEHEGMTMVPRARHEGGILGFDTWGDRKYGKGVTRRNIDYDHEENEYHVTSQKEKFRPDGKVCESV
jgi:hypothetical protein